MKTNWKLVLITTTLLVAVNIDKVIPKYNVESKNDVVEVQTDKTSTAKASSNETNTESSDSAYEDSNVSTKPCNDYVFVNNNTDIKETENENSNTLGNIDIYNKVFRISTDDNWDLIKCNGMEGYIKTSDDEEVGNTYVEVDISDQKVWYYKDNNLLVTSDVVTGKDQVSPTRVGWFKINGRRSNTYLKGPGYSSYVNYWMPFDKGIGLHDAPWRNGVFGGDIYLTSGSHGCVNMPYDTAKTIYENSSNGTKVLVHQ